MPEQSAFANAAASYLSIQAALVPIRIISVGHSNSEQVPLVQLPLKQSESAAQDCPPSHPVQSSPPQSMSDSVPLRLPSLQKDIMQAPFWQVDDSQSEFSMQLKLMPQPLHAGPPQSISVSPPFVTPSLQLEAEQVLFSQR